MKRLALTHHDPDHDDEFLERIEKLCQERFSDVFSVIIFCVWRLVKEKTAEEKEIAAEEVKKATPDPNEFH